MNSASVLHGGAAVGASRRQPLQEKLQFKNINDKKSNISKSLCENYPNGCSRESGAGVQPSAKLWHRRDLRPPPPPPLPPALLVATGGRDPAEEDRGPRTVRRRKYREKLLIRPPERTNAQTNDDVNWPTVKTTSGDNIFPTAPVREGGDCEMSHLTLRLDGREPRSDWKDLYHPPGARATEKCAAACQVTAGLLEKENSTDPSPEDLTVSSAGQTRWTQDTNESPLDVENSPALQRHYFVAVATCGGEEGSPSGERGSSRHSTAISRDVQVGLFSIADFTTYPFVCWSRRSHQLSESLVCALILSPSICLGRGSDFVIFTCTQRTVSVKSDENCERTEYTFCAQPFLVRIISVISITRSSCRTAEVPIPYPRRQCTSTSHK